MRARWVIPTVGLAGLAPCLYFFLPRMDASEAMGAIENWRPTHNEIISAIGRSPSNIHDDKRHIQFAEMFKNRFRDHHFAVGLKFSPGNKRVKVMFAPLILRWDMARVSELVLKEARDAFGAEYTADIYETYITAPMKKLGEARFDHPQSDNVVINFDPRFAAERATNYLRQAQTERPIARRPRTTSSMTMRPGSKAMPPSMASYGPM